MNQRQEARESLFAEAKEYLEGKGYSVSEQDDDSNERVLVIMKDTKSIGWIELAWYKLKSKYMLEFVTTERKDFDSFQEVTKDKPFRQWLVNEVGYPLIVPEGITVPSTN